MEFSITTIFIALLALIQIAMTIAVGAYRLQTDIRFMEGGDEGMIRRVRGHSNFIENTPMALLVMAAAEYAGSPLLLLWTGGAMLVCGRLLHYVTIRRSGWGAGRASGMLLTFIPIIFFAIMTLLALPAII